MLPAKLCIKLRQLLKAYLIFAAYIAVQIRLLPRVIEHSAKQQCQIILPEKIRLCALITRKHKLFSRKHGIKPPSGMTCLYHGMIQIRNTQKLNPKPLHLRRLAAELFTRSEKHLPAHLAFFSVLLRSGSCYIDKAADISFSAQIQYVFKLLKLIKYLFLTIKHP